MRRQPLGLLVTFAFVAVAKVAPSSALGHGERDDSSVWPSRNKEEERIDPVAVFKTLRLHKVKDQPQLFKNQWFHGWVRYMKLHHREDPEKAMLLTLNNVFDDQKVAAMIIEAKQVSKTKKLATELQEAQLQIWKSQTKSPDDVFAYLQLSKLMEDQVENPWTLFESPRFDMWTAYLEKFGNEIDVNEVIVQTLTTHSTDQAVAEMIMEAKQTYLEMTLKKEDVNKVIVQTLTTHFNDQVVAAIIIESKQVSETEAISTELQKAQLQLWKSQNKSPNDVYALVQVRKHIDDQARDLLTLYKSPRFGMWKTYLEMTLEEEIYVIEVIRENLLTHYPANRLLDLLTTTLFKAEKHSSEKQLTLNLFKAQLWSRYFNGRISNLARK
ncbi:hypothetical protein PsorP6_015644 [Peronosclerospora sorghi]|uniref:Uncharacterized protein n=1 Tax=Peronosclerospora sorghi TaxID=230839 RepID=A0ACC0WRT1_9STRA|nr:hypothetical protein PsorP6_015644 [Peronosclerospora sorghi]